MTVVSNTGPIISLSWIDRLDLLGALYGEVVVPLAVERELLPAGQSFLGTSAIEDAFRRRWLRAATVRNHLNVSALNARVDLGEAEAIALAVELRAEVLLVDDADARAEAKSWSIRVLGTIGVLRQARDEGHIDAARPLLLQMQRLGLWIGADLLARIRAEER